MKTLASIVLLVCTALAAHAQIRISELPEATNAAGAQFVIIQGGATKRIAEGTVRTIPATNVTGLGPFAISTNLAITNVTGLQGALDGKLATNGTLTAGNITGLGPFATATNLTAAQIGDFSNAVVAVAPPTTNASLLTTGTIEDTRISTNIARTSQLVASNIGGLGPFATTTNLGSSNISDFSAAVTAAAPPTTNASLLTTGTLADARLTTNVVLQAQLGPFATTTNLSSTNISDFSAAVTAAAPPTTNASLLTTGTLNDARLSTNVLIQPVSPGQVGAAARLTILTNFSGILPDTVLTAGRNLQQTFGHYGTNNALITLPATNVEAGDTFVVLANNYTSGSVTFRSRNWVGSGFGPEFTILARATQIGQKFTFRATANGIGGWELIPLDTHTHPVREITGLGPFATETNLLITNITGLQSALDGKLAINGTLPATNITGLGPFATATNLTSTNISDFQSAVTAAVAGADLFLNSLETDNNLTVGGDLIINNALTVGGNGISFADGGAAATRGYLGLGPLATATNLTSSNISDFSAAVTAIVGTNGGGAPPTTNAADLSTGTLADARLSTNVVLQAQLGPFATATTLAITNVTGLQSALDGKLATNGTLPATNITGLGPFATTTNLTSSNISDFSAAVTAAAPATTNAGALTTGTLDDARLSTNVVFQAQLGPFATATNLAITNVTGLQSALDGKLTTNGTLPATNITGLGPFATATNLTSTNISDFPAAVQALLTNTGISWSTVPTATNSAGTAGQIAYTNNYLYLCVASNQWRRVLLGTW